MKAMIRQTVVGLRMLVVLTVLTGLIYPLIVTGVARVAFPGKSRGDMIDGRKRNAGSRLIGQPFNAPEYFWSRPSATTPAYNAAASSGSNLGPTNPVWLATVAARVKALRGADPGNNTPVPADLVTASASGLDPHISPAGAEYQVDRVARARGLKEELVRDLVRRHTEERTLGIFGEPRVNVLELNLALDDLNLAA